MVIKNKIVVLFIVLFLGGIGIVFYDQNAKNCDNNTAPQFSQDDQKKSIRRVLASFWCACVCEESFTWKGVYSPAFYRGCLFSINMNGTPEKFRKEFSNTIIKLIKSSEVENNIIESQNIFLDFKKFIYQEYNIDAFELNLFYEENEDIFSVIEDKPKSIDDAVMYRAKITELQKMFFGDN